MKSLINEAVLHITTCCTHHCPFCYALTDNIIKKHQDTAILKEILLILADNGCKSMLFVGGDPASHPQAIELGHFAKDLGMESGILSNTLSFDGYYPLQVTEAFDFIEATIHSAIPERHDSFCQMKGAYANVVSKLRDMNSGSSRLGIVINLTPETYMNILEIIKRVVEIDKVHLDHVVFQRIVSIGRAYKRDDWKLTADHLQTIFEQIEQAKSQYGLVCNLEDTFPLCVLPHEYRQYATSCQWGTQAISLDMYGNVAKCCADSRYIVGNILQSSFEELWMNSAILKERREGGSLPTKCIRCAQYDVCGGGCLLASELNDNRGDPLLI